MSRRPMPIKNRNIKGELKKSLLKVLKMEVEGDNEGKADDHTDNCLSACQGSGILIPFFENIYV
jgi:hypothetical protein